MGVRTKEDTALESARRVLRVESDAVRSLAERLDGEFLRAVDLILETRGKVIVCGMGKSGIICQKIASTLSSTGTPAFFLHPAEGVHGDLGMISRDDIMVAVSNSGETEELTKIIPAVKRAGVKMIAMTGGAKSTLARYADVVLDVGVKEEACSLGLSPTASTTAALAMGDALAVTLLERRGFKAEDFAELHPAGSLGRKLMKVSELMHTGEQMPMVNADTPMKEAILEMTRKRLGVTGVFDGGRLAGVITDGDLRRAMEKGEKGGPVMEKTAGELMTRDPKTITEDSLAETALRIMEEHSITSLFVTGEGGRTAGVVHMHDLLRAGVV